MTDATTACTVSHQFEEYRLGIRPTEDGDGMCLGTDRTEAHLHEDSRSEELSQISKVYKLHYIRTQSYRNSIAVVHDGEIHQNTAVDLPVT